MIEPFELLHLYISPGHNFFGRYGSSALDFPIQETQQLECVAGQGVRGDRFFDHKPDYKRQITFFAYEVYLDLCEIFTVWDKPPGVFRRNVVTRGLDLAQLIGQDFLVQGVRFVGMEECRPCYWMDQAFHPGTEEALRGRGGLRARILTSGTIRPTANPADALRVA